MAPAETTGGSGHPRPLEVSLLLLKHPSLNMNRSIQARLRSIEFEALLKLFEFVATVHRAAVPM